MMFITNITYIQNYGVFQDFRWAPDLPEFGKFNLIYGWNGTGKTTISRLFRYLEKRQNPNEGEISIKINGRNYTEEQFEACEASIRVFNQDFIAESVFTENGEVAPIFIIGKENVEKQKEVDMLQKQLTVMRNEQITTQQQLNKAKENYDRFCTDSARAIKNALSASPPNEYNNYNRGNFKAKAESLLSGNSIHQYLLDNDAKDRCKKQRIALPKDCIPIINYNIPDLKQVYEEAHIILSKTVVASAIETLKDDPDLATWVRDGLAKHKERMTTNCLFCMQSLPHKRLQELEAHFSAAYETFISEIDAKIDEINNLEKDLDNLILPNKAEFYNDLNDDYIYALNAFSNTKKTIILALKKIKELLIKKKGAVFESYPFLDQAPEYDAKALEKINEIIRKHNTICDNFNNIVSKAVNDLENDFVAQSLDEYKRLVDDVNKTEEGLKCIESTIDMLENKIETLENEIIEHRRSAGLLNNDLREYLGHDELRLEVMKTGYVIKRSGETASHLSEGEQTAIALLYFLRSLEDRSFDLKRGVVVLDDPVSSLDANALFSAFGFIRERTQEVGQLFILTHNFTFFCQVRNWFHHLKGQNKKDINSRPARFFMLTCYAEASTRCAKLQRLDPLLEKYNSEYHYLFAYIYRIATEKSYAELGQYYLLPNIARRVLEAFLTFRRPNIDNLWEKLKSISYDEQKKIKIYRFVNVYSHNEEIEEFGHDLSILSETKNVLRDLLELIKTEDDKHFSAMESLATFND